MRNYSQAIVIDDQILKRNPTDFGALEVKAMSLICMGRNAAAMTVLNDLVSEGQAVPWVLDDGGVKTTNIIIIY